MPFPSSVELMNADLTDAEKLRDYAYHLVAQTPFDEQINWAQTVADTGRIAQVVCAGDFVNVFIDEGNRVGARVFELSVLRHPQWGFIVYHLNITRNNRPLTKMDKLMFDRNGWGDMEGYAFPQYKYRKQRWNSMEMSDGGFMCDTGRY